MNTSILFLLLFTSIYLGYNTFIFYFLKLSKGIPSSLLFPILQQILQQIQSFNRAPYRALVELYIESQQSFLQSFKGTLQRASNKASSRVLYRAPYRASSRALVKLQQLGKLIIESTLSQNYYRLVDSQLNIVRAKTKLEALLDEALPRVELY